MSRPPLQPLKEVQLDKILKIMDDADNGVFLETKRVNHQNRKSLLFVKPLRIISCRESGSVEEKLREVNEAVNQGYFAAGFISYEAGYKFEDSLKDNNKYSFPLLWFGIYKRPLVYDHSLSRFIISKEEDKNFLRSFDSISAELPKRYKVKNIKPNLSERKYLKDIKEIKRRITRGDTYQVNFTFKHKFLFNGSVYQLYKDLREKQSVSYSALIKFGDFYILSFSPELFFRKTDSTIETRPMKGTLKRGRDLKGDRKNIKTLKNSVKDRSENVMIVDLLRNDLGRISQTGSVKTKELFKAEKYETLLQMISIIKGKLKKQISFSELITNIFPSGSVTGAPKIKTMQIIKRLEKEPRLIYTGSIGYISPDKKSVFNVAIRTLLINRKKKKGEMGIGSGVVYDSEPKSEYSECLLKAKFLTSRETGFQLIEAILYRPKKGYFLLGLHLKRLKSSSQYFNFCYNEKEVRKKLAALKRHFKENTSYRVRLLLSKEGTVDLTYNKLKEKTGKRALKAEFSNQMASSEDIFFYHKTTSRGLYDSQHRKARERRIFDLIFRNEKDEITEGAISNIIIKKGKYFYTPPVECGLLKGVYRQYLLNKKDFPLREKILYKRDIIEADRIYMCNGIRGMQEVKVL
jgi:para-aminobenzoate synthetase / 4-amino-4-deoxychorismate lyase